MQKPRACRVTLKQLSAERFLNLPRPTRAPPVQGATRPEGASECRARAFVVWFLPSLSETTAGRGVRLADSGSRAQIADGVRGPRADASESIRRAERAAPCLSPHVTHSPAGSLSAW